MADTLKIALFAKLSTSYPGYGKHDPQPVVAPGGPAKLLITVGGGGNGCLRKDGIKEPTRRGGYGLARALIFYIYYNTLLDGHRDTLELPHPATALPTLKDKTTK